MRVYLTRHGLTDWNVLGKIQGITDTDLNEEGKKQAEKTRDDLKETNIDVVIASPLKRAVETAKIITEGRNLELITDDRIIERCYGSLEGKNKTLLKDIKSCAFNFGVKSGIDGMEEFDDLYERTKNFFEEIKEKYQDKDVLVVFHAGNSIAARAYLEGYDSKAMEENLSFLKLSNCEVVKYDL
ncbi:MAG: histidine phosphatase family protein [Clostridia bacterium]|nr:histidine phosphatase family protein [Clostridia bacterium]